MIKLSEKNQDWFDRHDHGAFYRDDVKDYLIQKDAEITELNSQIEFKIKECTQLAQACSRYKQSLAQHDKQVKIEVLSKLSGAIQPFGLINSHAGIKTIQAITNSINKIINKIKEQE